jgi:hypothetical protein
MSETKPDAPLLTLEEVRRWAVERGEALARVAELDRKLQGVRLLFPELATMLFGTATPAPAPAKAVTIRSGPLSQAKRDALPFHEKPITDVVLIVLEGENGGRPPRWFRSKLAETPGLAERIEKNPTAVSNALIRLANRGRLKKHGDNYYLPDVYDRIQRGELQEEAVEVEWGSRTPEAGSFNSLMHKAMMEHGKPFKAADAMEVAKRVPELREKLEQQPARVYSWLTREISRKKLAREGGFYFYPPERDEALNGKPASASVAGEAATSPIESQTVLRLIG